MPLESLGAPLFRLAIFVVISACLIQILALVRSLEVSEERIVSHVFAKRVI
jgi:hypothetical protein